MDLPKSMEAYYQETGRAGRDGEPAAAMMLYGLQDVVHMQQMLAQSDAGEQFKRLERYKLDALLGWCEITDCRRQALLGYFGDALPQPCGNCDTCLQPPHTWDASESAQKLLSCIYRSGQRFGAGHVIDVLRGQLTEKVEQYGHDKLSTFGIGKERSEKQWRSLIRQLLVRGLLEVDVQGFGALRLTEKCRSVLRGEEKLALRLDTVATERDDRARIGGRVDLAEDLQPLWKALRECRKRVAEEQGVAPYMVFHDATLRLMALYQPVNDNELLGISGVGQRKLDNYGTTFLQVIRAFREGEIA
jgi:ATP-dependent DNA helicase RecQ